MCVFFFCKQKTAYEMRISDWSSDVCSSDLGKTTMPWNGRLASAVRNAAGTETRPFWSTLFSCVPMKIATLFPCGFSPAYPRPLPPRHQRVGKACRSLPSEWDNLGYHGIAWVSMPRTSNYRGLRSEERRVGKKF